MRPEDFAHIDFSQIDRMAANAQRVAELSRPSIDRAIEVLRRTQIDIQPYLPKILEAVERMQPVILRTSSIYFVPSSTLAPTQTQSLPAEPSVPPTQRLKKNICLVAGNSFKYKNKTLRAVTLTSKPGKLLRLLLTSNEHFATDAAICRRLGIEDMRSFSYVLRDLKKFFQRNGLEIIIEDRKNPDGYILIDILKTDRS